MVPGRWSIHAWSRSSSATLETWPQTHFAGSFGQDGSTWNFGTSRAGRSGAARFRADSFWAQATIAASAAMMPSVLLFFMAPPSAFCLNSGPFRRLRIPLPLAHARDRHAREHARLLERVRVREGLRLGAAANVDDQQATNNLLAVVGKRCSGDDQYVLLTVEIGEMRLQAFFTPGGKVRRRNPRN